jgi:peptide/nickel transport system permease protein
MSTIDVSSAMSSAPVTTQLTKPLRKRRSPLFWIAAAFLLALIVVVVFADFMPFVQDPNARSRNRGSIRAAPSLSHWFGTDKIGRDLFAQCIYGARISLSIAAFATLLGMAVAVPLGLISGYFGGRLDSWLSTVMDIMLAYPPIILLLAATTFVSRSASTIVICLAVLAVPPLTRIVRASTLSYESREFVTAARSLGASNRRIIVKEILPNVVPTVVSTLLTTVAVLIIAEGGLSVLGQSVDARTPTWGKLINDGRQQLENYPHLSLMPALMLSLTIISLNMIGDELSKRFDIKESLA